MVHEAPLKIYVRGVVSYIYFSRAPRARARAENKANQQSHFKSSRCRMELLGTDSCRGTVPMEPPISNSSMRHQNPDLDFDDTGHFLQGASCTIAVHGRDPLFFKKKSIRTTWTRLWPTGLVSPTISTKHRFRGTKPRAAMVHKAPCRK